MADRSNITPDLLCKLLRYEPDSGELTWLSRPDDMFSSAGQSSKLSALQWNRKFAGKPALACVSSTTGYRCGALLYVNMVAHRVAWALHYGEWPNGEVDHINGDKTDNRICNLRIVTSSENKMNMKRRTKNKSGTTGVCWSPPTKQWRVQICANRKRIHVGMFATFADAVAARKSAERRLGFHENHDRA